MTGFYRRLTALLLSLALFAVLLMVFSWPDRWWRLLINAVVLVLAAAVASNAGDAADD